jgi:hypothetical protein
MADEHDDGEEGGSKLSPADVKAIVAELLQTEPLKKLLAVAEKMEGGAEEEEVPGDDGNPPPGEAGHEEPPLGAEPGMDAGMEGPERGGEPRREDAGAGAGGMGPGGADGYSAVGSRSARTPYNRRRTPQRQSRGSVAQVPEYTGDWRQWLEDYEAMNHPNDRDEHIAPIAEAVGRQDAELKRYKRENSEMAKRLAALERENVALEINGTLAELAKEYVLDEEEEFKDLIRMSKKDRDQRYDQIKRRYAKRADEVPGGGDYAMTRDQEAVQPTRMGGRRGEGPVNRFARTPEEASNIANEMARRGITDPDEFFRKIQEEQEAAEKRASRNGQVRTR